MQEAGCSQHPEADRSVLVVSLSLQQSARDNLGLEIWTVCDCLVTQESLRASIVSKSAPTVQFMNH